MRCREVRQLLAVYRELSAAEQAEVRQHLASCYECARALEAYRAQDGLLGSLPALSASPHWRDRVLAATTRGEREPTRAIGHLARATATILVVVMVSLAGAVGTSAQALPGDVLYVVKRLAEDVRLTLTFDAEARLDVVAELAERRREEVRQVQAEGRDVDVSFEGRLEAVVGDVWIVDGIQVAAPGGAEGRTPVVGNIVAVEAKVDGGRVSASHAAVKEPPVMPRRTPTVAVASPTSAPSPPPSPTTLAADQGSATAAAVISATAADSPATVDASLRTTRAATAASGEASTEADTRTNPPRVSRTLTSVSETREVARTLVPETPSPASTSPGQVAASPTHAPRASQSAEEKPTNTPTRVPERTSTPATRPTLVPTRLDTAEPGMTPTTSIRTATPLTSETVGLATAVPVVTRLQATQEVTPWLATPEPTHPRRRATVILRPTPADTPAPPTRRVVPTAAPTRKPAVDTPTPEPRPTATPRPSAESTSRPTSPPTGAPTRVPPQPTPTPIVVGTQAIRPTPTDLPPTASATSSTPVPEEPEETEEPPQDTAPPTAIPVPTPARQPSPTGQTQPVDPAPRTPTPDWTPGKPATAQPTPKGTAEPPSIGPGQPVVRATLSHG